MSTKIAAERVYNFSAGPSVLPMPVLEQIHEEFMCLPGVGSSILEISHRGDAFIEILDNARNSLRQIYRVPDNYEIMFIQGGASLQNILIPANLMTDDSQTADYIVTGGWGQKSAEEVHHYGQLNLAWDGESEGYFRTPDPGEIHFDPNAAFVHYTSNETIHGVQFQQPMEAGNVPIVCDQSSDILSKPCDISQFGMVYACAQKNTGIAGATIVIIRKDLLERSGDRLPTYLSFQRHAAAGSMVNTPPTFAIYVTGLVCRWLQSEFGSLEEVQKRGQAKAKLLYDVIDAHPDFYSGHARITDRSVMNVSFHLPSEELRDRFVDGASKEGMTTLKGHRSLGGIRASLYNAMPHEGAAALASFMVDFFQKNG